MSMYKFKHLISCLPSQVSGVIYRGFLRSTGYSLRGYEEHKCIFVRIPKCATRSLSMSMFGNKGGGHTDILSYRVIFGVERFENFFKFSFVRNPWDRVLSAYYFLKDGGLNSDDARWASRHLARYSDFRTFVKQWMNPESVRSRVHFRPQYEFLCDDRGQLLVDFVGHYESLERDFAYVAKRLSLRADLMHTNRTDSRPGDFREHYDDESIAIVADVYQKDIHHFDYRFD